MFNCVDRLLCFVATSELVAFINFSFASQFVALDYVDVRDREELSESRRQKSTLRSKIYVVNHVNLLYYENTRIVSKSTMHSFSFFLKNVEAFLP